VAILPSVAVTRLVAVFLAQMPAGAEPKSWVDVLRHDVAPVLAAYLAYLGFLVAYARGGARRRAQDRSSASWPDLIRYLLSMLVGGYLFFLLIVVVFYFVLGNEPRSFVTQALGQGSLLAFVIVGPAFLALSWVADRLGRSALRRPEPPVEPSDDISTP